jgi:hypothetical protein
MGLNELTWKAFDMLPPFDIDQSHFRKIGRKDRQKGSLSSAVYTFEVRASEKYEFEMHHMMIRRGSRSKLKRSSAAADPMLVVWNYSFFKKARKSSF